VKLAAAGEAREAKDRAASRARRRADVMAKCLFPKIKRHVVTMEAPKMAEMSPTVNAALARSPAPTC
jgi:hypothetical protein